MLDSCAAHAIGPDIQIIPIQEIDDAYRKVAEDEVRFRSVIDLASLKREAA